MKRLALIMLVASCATTKKVDRAADGVAAVAASIQRVTDRLSPLPPAVPSPLALRPASPLDAALAAAPTVIGDAVTLWQAIRDAVAAAKAAHAAQPAPDAGAP